MDVEQFRPGLLMDGRHPLQKHLHEVIAGAHPHPVNETQQERVAFRRAHLAHLPGIECFGLGGEMLHQRWREAVEWALHLTQRL